MLFGAGLDNEAVDAIAQIGGAAAVRADQIAGDDVTDRSNALQMHAILCGCRR